IRAHGPCRILFLPEKAVRRLLETDTEFLYRYLGFLSDRIRYLNRKIGYLTAGSTERRLALYLHSFGTDSFSLTTSITSLSELLDVGRASLYRAFDKLTEDGFIQKDGRKIRLLKSEAMLQAYQ
ncbi:MAG: Crp/Fnr family transcriptional regulator, partial [Clostridia bacterium]|nr:Crp/Fnr family transcriptional regulator [Clostridia bacterium]